MDLFAHYAVLLLGILFNAFLAWIMVVALLFISTWVLAILGIVVYAAKFIAKYGEPLLDLLLTKLDAHEEKIKILGWVLFLIFFLFLNYEFLLHHEPSGQ